MKQIFFITVFLLIRTGVSAQAGPDSLQISPDADPKAVQHDTLAAAGDTSGFKPLYRRGIHYYIKTNMGNDYRGFIIKETPDLITLEDRSTHQVTELRRESIISVRIISSRQSFLTDITGENRYANSYLFATSAFPFKKDQVTFNCHWLILEHLDYAFTENWAVTMNSIAFYPMSIGVKYAYKLDEMNYIGGNVFGMGNVLGQSDMFMWGYGAYAKLTHGTSNQNFTLSGGLLGLNSRFFYLRPAHLFVNMPFTSLAYCSRVSQKVVINLEGWYLPELRNAFAGVGIKLVNNEERCWSFGCYGFINNFNTSSINFNVRTIPIPYVSLAQNF